MRNQPDEPLAQYTTQELWVEIRRRCDSAVLVFSTKKTEVNQPLDGGYHGVLTSCIGMVEYMKVVMLKALTEQDNEESD